MQNDLLLHTKCKHFVVDFYTGSCADMLKSSYPDGMNEILVAAILWELLQGLEYLHKMGIIHR